MDTNCKSKSKWLNQKPHTNPQRRLTLRLLIVAISLCLMGCGSLRVKDGLPASDLEALRSEMHKRLKPRVMASGKTYCIELARNAEQYDDCAADLEEYSWLSENDKKRALEFLDEAIDKLQPVKRWWHRLFR